ncbi:exodeoxyribonuclease VII large subunit [filamentous cyanobacterium LEGE 11480]|uniref:Exodeoxyribonuclease 7 large subunit n=1 Tax=Romeriopsis navalis LEGE 11480 TaxID=2777977 RepID=A0A928VS17_9CYAN|nr:exodeoxyribonuclease VII large subunit [Romeriopsis navalis]MBE9031507.1 exodeoxyribonuclease VII large subunit [Romeriopsis navalis LEGE 11480]
MLDQAISVAGLTEYIQTLLEDDHHLRQIWVVGEVSSANPHRSGMFFALQDPDSQAMINCVAWKSQLAKFATLPEKGEQVILLGSVKLYPGQGRYQLTAWQCFPAGEGLQALRYRQLKQRLETEGLFDPEVKQALPVHPQTIAVVTSTNAAAWGDIQRTLLSRYPGLDVLLSPAVVQGLQAPKSIVTAIARVVRDQRAEVLLLARGGGAAEDLACFNDETVVRAIATCPIPVITGIGHERDESLCDLVADYAAHTPTAAAAKVVPDLDELYDDHRDRVLWLQTTVRQRLRQEAEVIEELQARLSRVKPDRLLVQERQRLGWLRQSLIQQMRSRLSQAQQRQQLLQEKASSLDPAAVLQRGYAVMRAEGEIVRQAVDLPVGQEVEVQLGQGKIRAVVSEVLPE